MSSSKNSNIFNRVFGREEKEKEFFYPSDPKDRYDYSDPNKLYNVGYKSIPPEGNPKEVIQYNIVQMAIHNKLIYGDVIELLDMYPMLCGPSMIDQIKKQSYSSSEKDLLLEKVTKIRNFLSEPSACYKKSPKEFLIFINDSYQATDPCFKNYILDLLDMAMYSGEPTNRLSYETALKFVASKNIKLDKDVKTFMTIHATQKPIDREKKDECITDAIAIAYIRENSKIYCKTRDQECLLEYLSTFSSIKKPADLAVDDRLFLAQELHLNKVTSIENDSVSSILGLSDMDLNQRHDMFRTCLTSIIQSEKENSKPSLAAKALLSLSEFKTIQLPKDWAEMNKLMKKAIDYQKEDMQSPPSVIDDSKEFIKEKHLVTTNPVEECFVALAKLKLIFESVPVEFLSSRDEILKQMAAEVEKVASVLKTKTSLKVTADPHVAGLLKILDAFTSQIIKFRTSMAAEKIGLDRPTT